MLARGGDLATAAQHFRHALRSKPDNAEAHNNLGNVLDSQGDLEQAAFHYELALRINPEYASARENLQRVLLKLKRSDRRTHETTETAQP